MSETGAHALKRHRIEMRVTPEQDALIRQAADLEHATVTAFVLETVAERAAAVIEQHRDVTLSNTAFDRFVSALDDPPQAVPQLTDLFHRHPRLSEA